MIFKQYPIRIVLMMSAVMVLTIGVGYSTVYNKTFLDRIFSNCLYPFILVQNSFCQRITSYQEKRKSVAQLHETIAALENENERLLGENIELASLIDCAQDTQALAAFKQSYAYDFAQIAQVILKHFSEQGHYFLIDKGSKAGIHINMVVVFKNCLLGKVTEVFPYYSKVVLITDRTVHVAALCNTSKATGIHQGLNDLYSTGLKHISHLCALEKDELILSTGDGLIFPRGFGLGRIKSFYVNGLFYEVAVEPLVDLHQIKYVYVIQKGATQEPFCLPLAAHTPL